MSFQLIELLTPIAAITVANKAVDWSTSFYYLMQMHVEGLTSGFGWWKSSAVIAVV